MTSGSRAPTFSQWLLFCVMLSVLNVCCFLRKQYNKHCFVDSFLFPELSDLIWWAVFMELCCKLELEFTLRGDFVWWPAFVENLWRLRVVRPRSFLWVRLFDKSIGPSLQSCTGYRGFSAGGGFQWSLVHSAEMHTAHSSERQCTRQCTFDTQKVSVPDSTCDAMNTSSLFSLPV
jgi:hypothetical protein